MKSFDSELMSHGGVSGSLHAASEEAQEQQEFVGDLGIVAVGVASGQGKPGVELGPAALLGYGLIERLESQAKPPRIWHDYTVHTYRDLGEPDLIEHLESVSSSSSESSWSSLCNQMRHPLEVSHATECLAHQVYEHASQGHKVLTLGGDHSVAIGSIAGSAKACRTRLQKGLGVIWVDAHADINTPDVSNSGNIHGMPLAFLTSLVRTAETEPFGWLGGPGGEGSESAVDLGKLVYIGLRDVEPEEQKVLDKYSVKYFTSKDVRRQGIEQVMKQTLAYLGQDCPIHLSFDIDALDPSIAPATGTPVEGGLTLEEGTYICGQVKQSGQMLSMDLVEVNPQEADGLEAPTASQTVEAGLAIVASAFGGGDQGSC